MTLVTLNCLGQEVVIWKCTISLWVMRQMPHLSITTSNHIISHTGKLRLRSGKNLAQGHFQTKMKT